MKAKNKMTKMVANALLALSLVVGVTGITTLQANAERAYEPYAVSFGGSGSPREGYIKECYVPTRGYDNGTDSSWHYFQDSYCKEGVGFQLRNRLGVEPTFAGSPNAGIGDPLILIGGLKAKLVPGDSADVKKLHIEGYYELNLKTVWTTSELQASGGPINPYYDVNTIHTNSNEYKEHNEWLNSMRPEFGIQDGHWQYGDVSPEEHYWYNPITYNIQLLVNGKIVRVPLKLPNNKMIYDKDAILRYPEEIFAGDFSQDIYLPNKDSMDKGQTTLSKNSAYQMKASDLKSVVIDWVLSTNTKCGIAVPLDGTEADCSKHYIEDIGITYINDHRNDGTADYDITFLTNAMNENQATTYEFDLEYCVDEKTYVVNLQHSFLEGERKHSWITVTLPKGAKNFVVKNVYNSYTGTMDTYRYHVQDFRLLVQDTSTSDGVVKVGGVDGNTGTITVNLNRQYKIKYDILRGVFDKEYPNIAGSATVELEKALWLAQFEYIVKDPDTGERKKLFKNERLVLKDESGEIDLSVDFPGNAEKITFLGISAPSPYDFSMYSSGKVVYRDTYGLPKPTEFSADFTATTQIVPGLEVREVRLRVDYASPNEHKCQLLMKYYDDGTEHDVVGNGNDHSIPSFTAKEGYHSYGWGETEVEYGNTNQPIHTIPKTCKYIKIVGIKDLDDGTVYDYNKYLYCEHDFTNDCDDECNWCDSFRATDEHPYVWVIDKEATDTEVGVKHEECPICGKKKTPVFIPALVTPDANNGGNGSGGSGSGDANGGNASGADNGGNSSGDNNGGNASGDDNGGNSSGDDNGGNASGNDNGGNASGDDNGGNSSGNANGGNASGNENGGNASGNNNGGNASGDANDGNASGADNGANTSGADNGGNASGNDIVKGEDGTYLGKGASEAAADHAILESTSEEEPAGAVFGKLQLKAKKITKKSIKISWKKINDCEYVVYGAKCGNKYKKLATTNENTYTMKNLKKGKYYKFIVVALKDGKVVSTSKSVHVATKGGKVGNYKLVKLNKTKITLKTNKTFKIKAKQIKDSKQIKVKNHRGLKYESSNTKVVKVTAKGKIKAVGKGTAYVYVYSQSGVFNKIKVKVK